MNPKFPFELSQPFFFPPFPPLNVPSTFFARSLHSFCHQLRTHRAHTDRARDQQRRKKDCKETKGLSTVGLRANNLSIVSVGKLLLAIVNGLLSEVYIAMPSKSKKGTFYWLRQRTEVKLLKKLIGMCRHTELPLNITSEVFPFLFLPGIRVERPIPWRKRNGEPSLMRRLTFLGPDPFITLPLEYFRDFCYIFSGIDINVSPIWQP